LTNQALEFIENNTEKPWFVYLSHHMIHGKVVAPRELTQKYRDLGYTDEGPNRAVYLAGLEHIDHSIGRLMTRLEELGADENTLIIFLSDNGGIDWRLGFKNLPVPNPVNPIIERDVVEYDNFPLRAGKGSAYEGGIRVPMLIRWPGKIRAGLRVEIPVHAVDIAPTLFNIAGIDNTGLNAKHILDGEDLMPLLKNMNLEKFSGRAIFQYYPFYDLRWGLTPCASIHKGDYKLMEFFGDRFETNHQYIPGHRIELYNLKEDIGETKNLSEFEPDKTKELLAELHAWMDELNVEASIENIHYNTDSMFIETKIKPDWID
jgi:arylsulfatase A-like enzyme